MTHAIHDFTAKLRQPSLLPEVSAYVHWRREALRARAEGRTEPEPPGRAPISINLDLTTACNYRCTHCIDWDILNTPNKHRAEELRRSLAWMASNGLRSVILIGGGEPTLFPDFAGFVAFLKELRLQVAVVSNGSRGDRLLAAAPHLEEEDWVRLSLDSASNELFVAMHRPTNPKCDLDSICAWIPRIKAANPKPRLGFSYIISWAGASRDGEAIHENIHEIAAAAARAKEAGFDYIAFKPVLERRPDGAEVMDPEHAEAELNAVLARVRAQIEEARRLADERFSVYESINLRVLEQGNWREFTHQPRTCHMQALRQVLTPTGLYNCPAHRGVEKAKIAGPEAWAGAEGGAGRAVAEILERFDASHECREVTCLYNAVNWWIEKAIREPSGPGTLEASEERGDSFL
jgi:sulfatase maturation enzyme AslB (radical SAM superfamily)